jgi:hypothetical protein
MMKKRVLLVFFVALCFTFLPNLQAFADNPKPGGTLRIGARIPQFNRIDVRYPTTGSMVPALDLIHQPLFGWEKDGLDNLIPVLACQGMDHPSQKGRQVSQRQGNDGRGFEGQPRVATQYTERVAPHDGSDL